MESLQVAAQAAMVQTAAAKDLVKNVETKGLLVGKPDLAASGMVADRVGAEATVGLFNADSKVGPVFFAEGKSLSLDTSVFGISYDGGAKNSPTEITTGFDFRAFRYLGIRVSGSYTPPDKAEFDLRFGAGIGTASAIFGVDVAPSTFREKP